MKKSKTSKSPKAQAAIDQDVVGLITTLVGKLVSLEAKIDTVLSRISERPPEAPRPQQQQQQHQHVSPQFVPRPRETRQMYKVICADCGKNCEVPFKPNANRSVYCKECFTKRKNSGPFPPRVEERPKEMPPEKPAAKKKPAVKKAKKKK